MTAKTRAALTTEVASQITNQTAPLSITPAVEGPVFQDIVDSAFNLLSGDLVPPANGGLGGTLIVATAATSQTGGISLNSAPSSGRPSIQATSTSGATGIQILSTGGTGNFAYNFDPTAFSIFNNNISIFGLTGSAMQTSKPLTLGNPGTFSGSNSTGTLNLAETGGGVLSMTAGSASASYTIQMPAAAGTANQVLSITGVTGSVLATAWATVSGGGGSGTVNSGTAGQFALYAATGTAVSGSPLYTYDTTAGLINGIALNAGATGAGAVIVPTLTGADTSASLTLKAAGTSQYSTVIGTSTWNTSYNGSTTQRLLMTTSAATFGTGLAVTVGSTLTTTGAMFNNSGTSKPTRAVTTATTTTTADYAVFANGTFTVTLHTPTAGQLLNIKNTGTGAITIAGTTDLGTTAVTAGMNISLIYDVAGATWRGQ